MLLIYLFIYLFGAKKADRFTVVMESMQSLFDKQIKVIIFDLFGNIFF